MSSLTLRKRIETIVAAKIKEIKRDKLLGDIFCHTPLILAGNGLTRLAVSLSSKGDFSWENLLKESLVRVGSDVTTDYLRSLGYTSAEIFEYAVARADRLGSQAMKDLWKRVWDAAETTQLSSLHHAVARLRWTLLTTNYDDLLEKAVLEARGRVTVWALTSKGHSVRTWSKDWKDMAWADSERDVYKLHGGFITGATSFDSWFKHGEPWTTHVTHGEEALEGPAHTIASRGRYESAAFGSAAEFKHVYGNVKSKLKGNTVVMIGLGFSSEELTVARLLRESNARVIVLTVDPFLDPGWRYERFTNARRIHIPLGLVASPESRTLAFLLALGLLAKEFNSGGVSDVDHKIIVENALGDLRTQAGRRFVNRVTFDGSQQELDKSFPQVIAVGQASVNHVIGLEHAVAQERAYAPLGDGLLTWTPEGKRLFLSNLEAGGQALIPCLVWDALSIPCALVARIYDDEPGQQILKRLQRTRWVDFEWTTGNQLGRTKQADPRTDPPKPGEDPPKPEKGKQIASLVDSVPATEHATIVTWFGLRTILDSHHLKDSLSFTLPNSRFRGATRESCFRLGAAIVYTTKANWDRVAEALRALPSDGRPLILHDTGGINDSAADAWVAAGGGIIIASALAAQRWLRTEKPFLTPDTDANFNDRCRDIKSDQDKWLTQEAGKDEPKDDRGRLWQIRNLLQEIHSQAKGAQNMRNWIPAFLHTGGALHDAHAYIVTVGELGCIYWVHKHSGWQGPRWSRMTSGMERDDRYRLSALHSLDRLDEPTIEEATDMRWERYAKLRNGLGCGDVARAGFVASLLASAGYQNLLGVNTDDIEYAVGWANWFGAKKLEYFAVDDYLKFLAEAPIPEEHLARKGRRVEGTWLLPDGDEINTSDLLTTEGKLIEEATQWQQYFEAFIDLRHEQSATRKAWNREIAAWQAAREYPPKLRLRLDD